MRTLTAGERTTLASAHLNIYVRVAVQDADGAWVRLDTLRGLDWVEAVQWQEGIDEPTLSGSVTTRREVWTGSELLSLSPQLQASTLNRNAANAYAPLLNAGRGVRIWTATVAHAVAPAEADFRLMVDGVIDDVDWKGTASQLTIKFRDQGKRLQDRFIEAKRVYGSDAGTAVETVLQQLIADNPPVGPLPTVYTPVSPGWMIHQYQQDQVNLMEALRALALQIGWDFRYRWDDGTQSFRPTFFQPERTKTVPDATVGPDEYLDITQLALSDADIRNVIKVTYINAATGAVAEKVAEDAASVALYGRRAMEVAEASTSNIDSDAEAQDLADAILADLATPNATHEIETLYWWPVQLGDLYAYQANGVHYDQDQQYAVTGYKHELRGGDGRTTITARGKPAGAYMGWLTRARDPLGNGLGWLSQAFIARIGATDADETLRYTGQLGANSTGTLEWRRQLNDSTVSGPWTAWAPYTGPVDEVIPRLTYYSREVRLEVRDTASGETGIPAFMVVTGKMDGVDQGTGQVNGQHPFVDDTGADYGYPLHGDLSDATGHTAHSAVRDHSLRVLTGFFDRASDDSDDITQGASRLLVSWDSLNGSAQVDLAKPGVQGRILDNISETSARKHLLAPLRTQVAARVPSHGQNLLFNPGFEDDLSFWTSGTGISVVTDATKAHSGNKYLQLSVPSGATTANQADEAGAVKWFEVNPGDVIKLGGWLYRETGDGTCYISMALADKDKTNITYTPCSSGAGAWTAASAEVTVPAGKKYAFLYCQIYNATAPTIARFDDLYLKILRPTNDVLAGVLRSGMQDSAARTLTGFYDKSSDDTDDLAQGPTRKLVSGTALDASNNVDLSKAGVVGNLPSPDRFATPYGASYRLPRGREAVAMLDNPDFELGGADPLGVDSGWQSRYGTSIASYETASPIAGSRSLRLTARAAIYDYLQNRVRFVCRPGEKYYIAAKGYASNGGIFSPCLIFDSATGTNVGVLVPGYFSTGAAAVVEGIVTVPAGAAQGYVALRINNNAAVTDWAVIDEVRLRRALPDALPLEGRTPGVATIVSKLADTGHAASTMQDASARILTGFFDKSSDDTADLTQAANNKLVSDNEKTGASRGYGGFTNTTGGLVSTAKDSAARTLTGFFDRASDDTDDLAQGPSRRLVASAALNASDQVDLALAGVRRSSVAAATVLQKLQDTGNLAASTVIEESAGGRAIARGATLYELQDGEAPNFAQSYDQVPIVLPLPGGISYNAAFTGDQRIRFAATNVTVSGFTAVCRIEEVAGVTTLVTRTAWTAGGPPGTDPHQLNKDTSAQAYDDHYTLKYNVSVAPDASNPGQCYVDAYANAGAGWVSVGSNFYYSAAGTKSFTGETIGFTLDGMDLNDDFGLSKSSVTGFTTLTPVNASWYEATAPASGAATNASVKVPFMVLGS